MSSPRSTSIERLPAAEPLTRAETPRCPRRQARRTAAWKIGQMGLVSTAAKPAITEQIAGGREEERKVRDQAQDNGTASTCSSQALSQPHKVIHRASVLSRHPTWSISPSSSMYPPRGAAQSSTPEPHPTSPPTTRNSQIT